MTEIKSPPPATDEPYVDPNQAQPDEGDAESPKNDPVPTGPEEGEDA